MLNVIRMELHRMVHSISFYVTLALCVAMSCGMLVSLTPNKNRSYEQESGYYLVTDAEGRQYRISADEVAQKEAEWQNGDVELRPLKYGEVESVNPGAIAHFIGTADMFIGIFAALFAAGFYQSGFCKNVAGMLRHKYFIYVAQILCVILFSSVAVLLSAAGVVSIAAAALHYFRFTGLPEFGMYLLGRYLLCCAIGSLSLFLTHLLRSNLFSIIYSVLLSTTLMSAIISLLNDRISALFSVDFDISHYFASLYTYSFRFSSEGKDMTEMLIHAAALSICALVVYNGLGCLVLTKKDI